MEGACHLSRASGNEPGDGESFDLGWLLWAVAPSPTRVVWPIVGSGGDLSRAAFSIYRGGPVVWERTEPAGGSRREYLHWDDDLLGYGGARPSKKNAALPANLIFPNDLGLFRRRMLLFQHPGAVAKRHFMVDQRKLPQGPYALSMGVVASYQ